jgi:glycosyltransferase involved in cell wall biosynthesis
VRALVLLAYPRGRTPGQRYRLEQWAPRLEPLGFETDVVEVLSKADLRRLHGRGSFVGKALTLLGGARRILPVVRQAHQRWDVVVLHRTLLPAGPPVLERTLARSGVPIVYDFDDAIWVTKTTDANRALAWLKWSGKTARLCALARRVTVGTDLLAEYALRFNTNVTVIPPTVDLEHYTPHAHSPMGGPLVVGWSGSPTTVEYLAVVASALRRVAAQVPVQIRLMGADFPLPGLNVTYRLWRPDVEADELQRYDVGLMPLVDDDWTRGKGAMKALLYMAVGVPVVASPVGVTPNVVRHGCNGLLAATEDDWVEHLLLLARDPQLRTKMGAQGRAMVERWYAPAVQARRFAEVLRSAVG